MEIWKNENLEKWKFGKMEIWKNWKLKKMEIGKNINGEKWKLGKLGKQAVAELGQTQVKLEVIDEVEVEVRSWNCKESLSSTTCPGEWVVGGNKINTKLNSS